ncbi:hypothetical protein ACFW04_006020 [Cataglyphis niger]
MTKLLDKHQDNVLNALGEIDPKKSKRLIQSTIEKGLGSGTVNDQSEANVNLSSRREKTTYPSTTTKLHDKHQDNVLNALGEVDPKKSKRLIQSTIGKGLGTGTVNDQSEANVNLSSRREKTTYPSTTTKLHDKHQDNVLNALGEVDPKKSKRLIQSTIGKGLGTGTANDQSEANGNPSSRREKTRVSTSGARSEDYTKNIDTETARIREKRDNNPNQHRLGEVEDKDRQDRRLTQRDMQEEANRPRIAAGKTRKDGGTKNGNTVEESNGNPDKNPYHRREERETRLLDNKTKKIGRLDRVEEKSISIETSRPTKRSEVKPDGNERDRDENEENPTTRRDRKTEAKDKDEKEGTILLNKNKEPGNKKVTVSLDDAKEGRFAVNEEGKLSTNNKQRKAVSTEKRYDLEEARKWKVNSKCPQTFL